MFARHDPSHAYRMEKQLGELPPYGEPILTVEEVSLAFKGVNALTDVSFDVNRGEILSLIGPNGAGKTSMLNCISGRYRPTRGAVRYLKKDITHRGSQIRADLGIARTFQNLALFSHMTVLENVMVGRHCHMRNNFLTGGLFWLGGAQEEEMSHRAEVERIIEFFEIQHLRSFQAGTLPYGMRKRVELARALALNPQLMLLDEPMAGMNHEEKEDIARFVLELKEEWGVTILMIEHDMGVVMDISDHIVVLNYGKKIADGSPADVKRNAAVKTAYLGEDEGGV